MGACSNGLDEQFQQTEGQALAFNLSIDNGATTKTVTNEADRVTSWAKGDEVGLFVFKKGDVVGTAKPVHANIKLTYDGKKWSAASPIFSEAEYDFYAYYPYQAAASDPTKIAIPAKTNQSKEADYGLSDVMAAPKVTVAAKGTQVDLTFKHVFSLVEIQVSGELVKAAPAKVVLKNVKTASSLNLSTTQATVSGQAGDVIPQALTAKNNVYAYRAVVPAQTIAKETQLVQLQNGEKHYAFKYSTDVAYEAGKYRTLSVIINEPKVELTIPTPGITPWEPSAPGTGQGGTEEIVPPAPQLELVTNLDLPLNTYVEPKEFIAGTKEGGTIKLTSSKDEWFHRERSAKDPKTTVAVEGSKLKLTNPADKQGSWNNSCVLFHKSGKFERTTYKVTVTASSTDPAGLVGLSFSNVDDTKRSKCMEVMVQIGLEM
ncbi:hypothetical protein EVA_06391 [gut metagenome]|uniref:Uncharacterized protein n=1 Tax=gut metagenome TaxID=749906 RepID=J9GF09_9ZZZZ